MSTHLIIHWLLLFSTLIFIAPFYFECILIVYSNTLPGRRPLSFGTRLQGRVAILEISNVQFLDGFFGVFWHFWWWPPSPWSCSYFRRMFRCRLFPSARHFGYLYLKKSNFIISDREWHTWPMDVRGKREITWLPEINAPSGGFHFCPLADFFCIFGLGDLF